MSLTQAVTNAEQVCRAVNEKDSTTKVFLGRNFQIVTNASQEVGFFLLIGDLEKLMYGSKEKGHLELTKKVILWIQLIYVKRTPELKSTIEAVCKVAGQSLSSTIQAAKKELDIVKDMGHLEALKEKLSLFVLIKELLVVNYKETLIGIPHAMERQAIHDTFISMTSKAEGEGGDEKVFELDLSQLKSSKHIILLMDKLKTLKPPADGKMIVGDTLRFSGLNESAKETDPFQKLIHGLIKKGEGFRNNAALNISSKLSNEWDDDYNEILAKSSLYVLLLKLLNEDLQYKAKIEELAPIMPSIFNALSLIAKDAKQRNVTDREDGLEAVRKDMKLDLKLYTDLQRMYKQMEGEDAFSFHLLYSCLYQEYVALESRFIQSALLPKNPSRLSIFSSHVHKSNKEIEETVVWIFANKNFGTPNLPLPTPEEFAQIDRYKTEGVPEELLPKAATVVEVGFVSEPVVRDIKKEDDEKKSFSVTVPASAAQPTVFTNVSELALKRNFAFAGANGKLKYDQRLSKQTDPLHTLPAYLEELLGTVYSYQCQWHNKTTGNMDTRFLMVGERPMIKGKRNSFGGVELRVFEFTFGVDDKLYHRFAANNISAIQLLSSIHNKISVERKRSSFDLSSSVDFPALPVKEEKPEKETLFLPAQEDARFSIAPASEMLVISDKSGKAESIQLWNFDAQKLS